MEPYHTKVGPRVSIKILYNYIIINRHGGTPNITINIDYKRHGKLGYSSICYIGSGKDRSDGCR